MDIYATEKEQIEQLKYLWKTYALPVLVGMVIALIGTYFWHYWKKLEEQAIIQASIHYEQLLTNIAKHNTSAVTHDGEYLMNHYSRSVYAQLAALLLANEAVREHHYEDATSRLQWVLQHSKSSLLRQIARMRLARVLLANEKPQEALTLLQKVDDKNYQPLVDELKGNIYLALKQPVQARESFARALQQAPEWVASHPLLPMKLDNL